VPPQEILVAHRATRPRPRRLPALARRGAGGPRVAALAGAAAAAVTRYEPVELVSPLASDFPRFVAARLGPLAAATELAARLRGTVLASSPRTAAARGCLWARDKRGPSSVASAHPGRRMLIACRPTLSNQERTWA
jgi:hypothetical protein